MRADDGGRADYQNVPRALAIVISAGKATLHELETVYGAQDLYNLLEIIVVDAHNETLAARRLKQRMSQ